MHAHASACVIGLLLMSPCAWGERIQRVYVKPVIYDSKNVCERVFTDLIQRAVINSVYIFIYKIALSHAQREIT